MINGLTTRTTVEAIQTAGTVVRLSTSLADIAWDQTRKPSVDDDGFDLTSAIAADLRVIGRADPTRWRTVLSFNPADLTPNTGTCSFGLWRSTAVERVNGLINGAVVLPGTQQAWIDYLADNANTSALAYDGTVVGVDWDGDGIDDALLIDLPYLEGDPWGWEEASGNQIAGVATVIYYEALSAGVRVWMRGAAEIPDDNATIWQALQHTAWTLWLDHGVVEPSMDERIAVPARSKGWIELYNPEDPSDYSGGGFGDVAIKLLSLGVLLPVVAP